MKINPTDTTAARNDPIEILMKLRTTTFDFPQQPSLCAPQVHKVSRHGHLKPSKKANETSLSNRHIHESKSDPYSNNKSFANNVSKYAPEKEENPESVITSTVDSTSPLDQMSNIKQENHDRKQTCGRCSYVYSILLPLTLMLLVAVIIGITIAIIKMPTSVSTNPSTNATSTLSLYGVQLNLDPSSLSNGWSLCYTSTYAIPMNSSAVATILSSCNQNNLLLGCRPVGNSILTVAAMGARTDVLDDCSNLLNCTHVANGVGWYFSTSYSWGFAGGNDTVSRNSCDVGPGDDVYRLCWHTNGNGGYRCGNTTSLNSNTAWQRIIYQAN